jgi:hypothetical protein
MKTITTNKGNKMESGIMIDIYHSNEDCSNNGISKGKTRGLLLLDKGGPFTIEDAEKLTVPVFKVKNHPTMTDYKFLIPASDNGSKWYMAGGNIGYCCDNRFPNKYPLQIHDRVE